MTTTPLRIALVYPPFGPSGLPSLGLSLLAASLRRMGHGVQVEYWNLAFLSGLPADGPAGQDAAYRRLSDGTLFPFNERIFRQAAFGEDPGFAADLRASGLPVADQMMLGLLQLRAGASVAQAADRLCQADVVAIGSTFYQNLAALALAREIKRRNPAVVTVLGGANADAPMGMAHLRLHPMLDYVLCGEADHSFPALIEALARGRPPEGIPGLCHRNADGTPRPMLPPVPVADLDALPVPDHSDYIAQWRAAGLDRVNRLAIALESSRGCWWGEHNHCTFCGLNGNGMGFRRKAFTRFTQELAKVAAACGPEPPFFFMADNILAMDYFGPLKDWADQNRFALEFFYEIKANLRRDQVEHLSRSGITVVQPGIESFSSPILKRMRKGLRGIQNIAFLKYAADAGIRPVYNILSGFPGEDPQDVQRMVERLPQLFHLFPPTSAPVVEFHRYSPYHNDPAAFGLRLQPDPRYAALFPHDPADIAELAYRFVDTDRPPVAGLAALLQRIEDWKQAHRKGARLVHHTDPAGRDWVLDERDPARPSRTLLMGLASAILAALDAPHSVANILRTVQAAPSACAVTDYLEALVTFPDVQVLWISPEAFAADAPACVELLNSAGLLYREDIEGGQPLYLGLPTRAAPMRAVPTLERLGI